MKWKWPLLIIATTILLFGLSCYGTYWVLLHLGFYVPSPSEAGILALVSGEFDARPYGLSEEGLTIEVTKISRPGRTGVANPKMWIWVRAEDADGRHVAGLLNIALFDDLSGDPMDIGEFQTREELLAHPQYTEAFFTRSQQAKIRQLMERDK